MDIQPKKTNIPVNSDGKGDNIFKTPEQIASTEHPEPDIILDDVDTAENPTIDNNQASPKGLTTKKIHRRLWDKFQSLSKRRKVIVLIVTVVVLIGIVTGLVLALSSKTTPKTVAPPKQATIKTAPKPTTVASNLTGLQVDPSVNQRPVTG